MTANPNDYDPRIEYGLLGFNNWRIIFLLTAIPCFIRGLGILTVITSNLPFEELALGNEEKVRN